MGSATLPPIALNAVIRCPSLDGCDELAGEWIRRPLLGSGGSAAAGLPRYCENSCVRRFWYLFGKNQVSSWRQTESDGGSVLPFLCYVTLLQLRWQSACCCLGRMADAKGPAKPKERQRARPHPGTLPIVVTPEIRARSIPRCRWTRRTAPPHWGTHTSNSLSSSLSRSSSSFLTSAMAIAYAPSHPVLNRE